MKYEKKILNNGLKLIVHKDQSSSVVAFNLLYNVGARDEHPQKTGFAHLFEHLMFGGSINVPDFDSVLQKAGGENNAFTNNDITNYYITIPKENLETAFYIESDRMLELNFSQRSLDTQKSVVIEEYKQSYLNQPYGDASLYLRPLAFKVHPYQWSTIGKSIEHIENASLDDVKNFFYKHYAPNNAILVVAGNVETDEIVNLSEKWFGEIEQRDVAKRNLPKEPKQTEKRFLELERDVPADALYMAYHMCGRSDNDYYVCDLISDLLSNGKSSRFNINLIKNGNTFSEVEAYIQGTHNPSLFMISGKLKSKSKLDSAEKIIIKELEKIKNGEFSDRELEKTKNRVISMQRISRQNILNRAMEIAYSEWLGDIDLVNTIEKKYQNVTKKDIISVANEMFQERNLSTLHYKSLKK